VWKECYKSYAFEKSNLLNVYIYNTVYLDKKHNHEITYINQGKMPKQLEKH